MMQKNNFEGSRSYSNLNYFLLIINKCKCINYTINNMPGFAVFFLKVCENIVSLHNDTESTNQLGDKKNCWKTITETENYWN